VVTELRDSLRAQLPEYMVPAAFMILDALPLSTNGKVDRKRLPAPHATVAGSAYVAPRNHTEQVLCTIWCDILGCEQVGVRDNFFDCGGHSLLAIPLISRVKKQFGVTMELHEMFRLQTIDDMARFLDASIASSTEGGAQVTRHLVKLKDSALAGSPLFLVHPVGGYVQCYFDLCGELSHDGPVYGLHVEALTPASIPAMAEQYIKVIKDIQPAGPYLIGGWSMGGVIAYEMACQFDRMGEEIESIFMIDSFHPSASTSQDVHANERQLLAALALEHDIRFEHLVQADAQRFEKATLDELFETFVDIGRSQHRLHAEFIASDLKERFAVIQHNASALRSYHPTSSTRKIHLIRAKENRNEDRSLGWDSVATEVIVLEREGDHFSMMRRPHVAGVAHDIQRLIHQAQPVPPAAALA